MDVYVERLGFVEFDTGVRISLHGSSCEVIRDHVKPNSREVYPISDTRDLSLGPVPIFRTSAAGRFVIEGLASLEGANRRRLDYRMFELVPGRQKRRIFKYNKCT
jgi:hypothetical protein